MKSFITGSHAYGIPHVDSDIDLVVLLSEKDIKRLEVACDTTLTIDPHYRSYCMPFRFGKLNLICCTNERQFEVWRRGTVHLKKQAPVTRDFAIAYFKKLRAESGFYDKETE